MKKEQLEKVLKEITGTYWNYRWFKIEVEVPVYKDNKPTRKTTTEHYYELHEVYYDEDEKPFLWSEDCSKFQLENAEELLFLVEKSIAAADKKVLLLKDGEITELDEYMDEKEILKKEK